MAAQIIEFPRKPINEARLALVGGALQQAIPLADKDTELQLLITVADRLIGNMVEYQLDEFLVRLDKWDARTA
jgi:hypothetical protein